MALLVRSRGKPLSQAEPVRRVLLGIDPDQPILETTTLTAVVDAARRQATLYAGLLATFAAVGLVLAVIGIYGVLAYGLAQRHQELAVRVALGARSASLVRLVLGGAMRLTAWGIGVGWITALLASRWLGSVLYGVRPHDPLTFAAVPLVILAIAVPAGLLPARRVLRLDPARALRPT